MNQPVRATIVSLRVRKRSVLQIAAAGFLYLTGANAGATWVVVLAAAVAGTTLTGYGQALRAAGRLYVTRDMPAHAREGVPVTVSVTVTGRSRVPCVVHDGVSGARGALPGTGTVIGDVVLARGVAHGPVDVSVNDVFGGFTVGTRADTDGRCVVFPAASRTVPTCRSVRGDGSDGPAARGTAGTEVDGVRDYRHGDPQRLVHWRTAARRGSLAVKELAAPATRTVRVTVPGGAWAADDLDATCSEAAAVARAAAAGGASVVVAADGTERPWGPAAEALLAGLVPHGWADPEPLRDPPDGPNKVVIDIRAGP